MAISWSSRHQAARDDAMRVLHRTAEGFIEKPAKEIARALVDPTLAVLRDLQCDLDDEAEQRVLIAAAMGVLRSISGSIADAIADELARPEPMPFQSPPAGTWLRARCLPQPRRDRLAPRLTPEWSSAWHVFSGDLQAGDERSHAVRGLTRCGTRLYFRYVHLFTGEPLWDCVIADATPTVDICLRCLRIVDGPDAAVTRSVERRRRAIRSVPA